MADNLPFNSGRRNDNNRVRHVSTVDAGDFSCAIKHDRDAVTQIQFNFSS